MESTTQELAKISVIMSDVRIMESIIQGTVGINAQMSVASHMESFI